MPGAQTKYTPYWWEAAPLQSEPVRELTPACDIAIIGAGYAGLCAALHLARAGRTVQVFEREKTGFGASSRNGGITSGNLRPGAAALTASYGAERAARITAEGHEARRYLQHFISSEQLDCDFQPVGRFYGAMTRAEYTLLARQADELARETGVTSFAVPRTEVSQHISTDLYMGGSVRMDIGGLHPAKFQAALLRAARAAGVAIHSECRVESVSEGTHKHKVSTERGTVFAREVIVCTNGYTDHADRWLRQRLVPLRSRIIATEVLGSERVKALVPGLKMLTDTRAMTYYFRPSPDGSRLLFGGRDTGLLGDNEVPTRANKRELLRIFPELEGVQISHSWSGYVAMNRNMLPRIFNRGAIHYATGFCGSGVVWAPWLGLKIAEKLLGSAARPSAFDFSPPGLVPTFRGKAWFMPAVFANLGLQDRRALARNQRERSA
ncbi:NAD(P)/FAD-dependent oxidoreductase [Pseudogemmobacter faecipullorum]|uniref:FAD-binding oxidoreductase n=1 Tax=Pseudogemmobacter faecipullorum TaxID=2755041 RepID=A0ABS8CLW1_9RHOB|nr:FAD-binding oxidoreductase [Pseudogemmobacter faecipullorum]MCB5410374.1 FAD-binding oxidoreductase [Pseudogemmobacter faecipullorum]